MAIKLVFYKPIIGMDVEFFLKRGRSIVGSERILDGNKSIKSDRGSFVKDGVQIEINPVASYCREILGTSIAKCFQTFRDYLSDHSGITPCFDECVTVPSREFKTLSADSKRFGCDPDYNAHEGGKENIKVRGDSTRVRTAGGHIHFGSSSNEVNFKITGEKNEMLIKCKYCIKDCKEYKEDNFHSFPSVGKGGVNFWDIVNFNSLSKEKKIVVLNKSNMPKSKIESNVDK